MTGDEDYWSFFTATTPVARKDHRCDECGRTIHKGERYDYAGGRTYDGMDFYKTCAHCSAASHWLQVVCHGWVFGGRQEDLLDHVIGDEKELRSRPLTRLVRWMRADWQDRAGELRPVDAVVELTGEAIDAYKRQFAIATDNARRSPRSPRSSVARSTGNAYGRRCSRSGAPRSTSARWLRFGARWSRTPPTSTGGSIAITDS